MRFRHPEFANRIPLEVELDKHRGLFADDPPVMSRLNHDGLRSRELQLASVRIFNMDLAAHQEANVCVHAERSPDDRLHVLGPAKARLVDHALYTRPAGPDRVDLDAADFAGFAVR